MKTLAERLKFAMQKRGLKQPALARAASTQKQPVSQQNIQHLLAVRQLTSKHLPAIARALKVRLEWLTDGTGDMDADHEVQQVPLISFVQAGSWTEISDPYVDGDPERYIAADSQVGPRAYALRVKGDSQSPKYAEGDCIIVDPDVEPMPGDDVVGKLDNEDQATFKQYRPRGVDSRKRPIIELKPRNDSWPTITIDARSPGRVIGTVVEHHSYRRNTGT